MSIEQEFPKVSQKPFDDIQVPEGMVWQYRACLRGGRITHEWSVANELGGIHIHAMLSDFQGRREWIGGIECHWAAAPDYMNPEKPSHEHCWLLGKPCWHDGSSLYFSENIADCLPDPYGKNPHEMHEHNHRYVTGDLLRWHRDKVAEYVRGES